jgi:hypothetical protein
MRFASTHSDTIANCTSTRRPLWRIATDEWSWLCCECVVAQCVVAAGGCDSPRGDSVAQLAGCQRARASTRSARRRRARARTGSSRRQQSVRAFTRFFAFPSPSPWTWTRRERRLRQACGPTRHPQPALADGISGEQKTRVPAAPFDYDDDHTGVGPKTRLCVGVGAALHSHARTSTPLFLCLRRAVHSHTSRATQAASARAQPPPPRWLVGRAAAQKHAGFVLPADRRTERKPEENARGGRRRSNKRTGV